MATPNQTYLNNTFTNVSMVNADPEEKLILNVQKAFEMAGGKGFYQKRLIALLSTQRIFIGFLGLCFPFLFLEPTFRCRDSLDQEWQICKPTPINCMRMIEPVPDSYNTLVTEFDLYCESKGLIAMSLTLYLATTCIGIFLLASLPDTKGRKRALLWSNYALVSLILGCVIIPNRYYVLLMIGLIGLGLGPNISYTFMYLNEITDMEYRQTGTVVINAVRSVGQMFLGPLCAIISNDWRLLLILYIGIPLGAAIPLIMKWVDEPPGYAVLKCQYSVAKETILKIAQVNGSELKDFVFAEEIRRKATSIIRRYPPNIPQKPSIMGSIRKSIRLLQKAKSYHYPDLIKYGSIKSMIINLTIVSIVQTFCVNAMTWSIPAIDAPTSWVTFALSLGELLSCLFGAFLYVHLKRRPLYILCHGLQVISCLPFVFLDAPAECTGSNMCWQNYTQIFLVVVARCSVAVVNMLFFIYAAELFPTPIRSLGTGLVSVLQRSGSILSPMMVNMFIEGGLNPMTAMGLMGIPAVVVCFNLKETKGKPLPDEIEEEKQLEMRLLDSRAQNICKAGIAVISYKDLRIG